MPVERINTYDDPRFSPDCLRQHGCYLVDGTPCEVRILSADTAAITGCPQDHLSGLIDAFRFNAPHITRFVNSGGALLRELPPVAVFPVALADIQPSQFFVDEEKLAAVGSFIAAPEDVIIPLAMHPMQPGRFISLDGHTRLFLAAQEGWTHIRAVMDTADSVLLAFADEAARRGVHSPGDMMLLPHGAYEEQWNRFCDSFIASLPEV